MRSASPLRYPGGKWRLSRFFVDLLSRNFRSLPLYIEPYAGGAGLALSLLLERRVSGIWLNDLDPAIYACWSAILNERSAFCKAVLSVPLTLAEWRRQKRIYAGGMGSGLFALGFATFYLNRTNHSGILNGGMIGGTRQAGEWKLDARFNREDLVRRITRVSEEKKCIKLTCLDAGTMIGSLRQHSNSLVYIDPPYVGSGGALYMNYYREADHEFVRDKIRDLKRKWVVSYDNVPLIKKLYRGYASRSLQLLHTARSAKLGSELLFFSKDCVVPRLTSNIRSSF